MSDEPVRVLFVSTSNAARSILAEAILRQVGAGRFEAMSAGIAPTAVHPLTRQVLGAAGFDHDWAVSRRVDDLLAERFDYVITLCDDARLVCSRHDGDELFESSWETLSAVRSPRRQLPRRCRLVSDGGSSAVNLVFDDDRYQSAAIMTIGFKPVKGAKEEVCRSV